MALAQKAISILEWSLDRGWDQDYGGIMYYADIAGKPCVQYEWDMKLWWPHTEALYATLLAYHITGDAKWLDWYNRIHDYTFSHFPDTEYGEWYGYLHRDGSVSHRLKGNCWKGPFHISRCQMLCSKLLREM
jgi:N-acylglucosamine 2-epimerase